MTINESIEWFCRETGYTAGDVCPVGPIRSKWLKWLAQSSGWCSAAEFAETWRLLAEAQEKAARAQPR